MASAPVHPSDVAHPSMAHLGGVPRTPSQAGPVVRHTTPENIKKIFDPSTYRSPKCGIDQNVPTYCQKRPLASEASSASATKSLKTMERSELVEKFKLAASLNGIDWSELAVPGLIVFCIFQA